MAKYYIDTCIWRDYYENRVDRFRPLGEWAHRLLNMILLNKEIILSSEMIMNELRDYFKEGEVKMIFKPYEKVIQNIKIDKGIMSIASGFRTCLSRGDAIHAAIAKKHFAILITRDKHFESVEIEMKKPEDLF